MMAKCQMKIDTSKLYQKEYNELFIINYLKKAMMFIMNCFLHKLYSIKDAILLTIPYKVAQSKWQHIYTYTYRKLNPDEN